MDLNVPHYITGARTLIKSDTNIQKISDPSLGEFASTKNTSPFERLLELKETKGYRFDIIEVEEHKHGVALVESGQADDLVMEEILLKGITLAEASNGTKIVDRHITIEPLAFMLSKTAPNLKSSVDLITKSLILDGHVHPFYSKRLENRIPPTTGSLKLPVN